MKRNELIEAIKAINPYASISGMKKDALETVLQVLQEKEARRVTIETKKEALDSISDDVRPTPEMALLGDGWSLLERAVNILFNNFHNFRRLSMTVDQLHSQKKRRDIIAAHIGETIETPKGSHTISQEDVDWETTLLDYEIERIHREIPRIDFEDFRRPIQESLQHRNMVMVPKGTTEELEARIKELEAKLAQS